MSEANVDSLQPLVGKQIANINAEKQVDHWREMAKLKEEEIDLLKRQRADLRSALTEAENELRNFGSFDGHIERWEQSISTANVRR